MKIRTRIFLAFLLVCAAGFYFLVQWIIGDLRPRYLEAMEESLVDTATVLSSLVAGQVENGEIRADSLRLAFEGVRKRQLSAKIYAVTKRDTNLRVYVTDDKGKVVFDSDKGRDEGKDYSQWNDVKRTLRGEYGARATWENPDDPMSAILYVASPVRVGDRIVGVLTVCKPANSVSRFVRIARRKILVGGCIAAVVVLLMATAISLWITRPIGKLTAHAMDIKSGGRGRLPKLGKNEIGELGQAFEQMRDALEGKQYVEKYVQTLTHEMKSPLSAIRGAAELIDDKMAPEQRRKFAENIRAESARIQDLVDRMLELSSLESRKSLINIEEIRVPDLLNEAVESIRPALLAKDIRATVTADGGITVRGEKFLVRQAVVNLVQNAADFSPAGSEVRISCSRAAERIVITVTDSGPGVPEYALNRVFEKFYSLPRPGTGKKSSGLGLAFVREVATLHGGETRLENRPEGGAVATLVLPA